MAVFSMFISTGNYQRSLLSRQGSGREGIKARLMHLNWLWPFPSDIVSSAMKKCQKSFVVENNFSGQLAHLIRAETGLAAYKKITKDDGRPFYSSQIIKEVAREV